MGRAVGTEPCRMAQRVSQLSCAVLHPQTPPKPALPESSQPWVTFLGCSRHQANRGGGGHRSAPHLPPWDVERGPGAAPAREQLERWLAGQSSRRSRAVMDCCCLRDRRKIDGCAAEWQRQGPAAPSAWPCRWSPVDRDTWAPEAWRRATAGRSGVEEQSRPARVLGRTWRVWPTPPHGHSAYLHPADHHYSVDSPDRKVCQASKARAPRLPLARRGACAMLTARAAAGTQAGVSPAPRQGQQRAQDHGGHQPPACRGAPWLAGHVLSPATQPSGAALRRHRLGMEEGTRPGTGQLRDLSPPPAPALRRRSSADPSPWLSCPPSWSVRCLHCAAKGCADTEETWEETHVTPTSDAAPTFSPAWGLGW